MAKIVERLTDRKIAVEKTVLQLGEAPSGLKDVFELCRGFERAFSTQVNDSQTATKIKEAFYSDRGLTGAVRGENWNKIFELDNVKKVCKRADGYQPHLVSPERGLRLLACEALTKVEPHVTSCVDQVYQLLIQAARDAADAAGHNTEAALAGKVPLYVPDFKNIVIPAIIRALDDWKAEATRVAFMLVDMERSYITAGFFRSTMYHRAERMTRQVQMERAADSAVGGAGSKSGRFGRKFTLRKSAPQLDAADDFGDDGFGPVRPAGAGPSQPSQSLNVSSGPSGGLDTSDHLAAYFDKKVDADGTKANAPVESWKWQRRFFIYSEAQKTLYYFKNREEVSKANGVRGQVSMTECIVEDLDSTGSPVTLGSSKGSLLLRIRNKDPRKPCVKEHNQLVLRAESAVLKNSWLTRMATAAGGGVAAAAEQPAAPAKSAAGLGAAPPGAPRRVTGPEPVEEEEEVAEEEYADPVAQLHSADAMDTAMGEGSKMFRAESLRDNRGLLLPAPGVVVAARGAKNIEDFESRYDHLMEQFGNDMSLYIKAVCDTVVTTVPKSVVHCLVRKAEKNLLNHLFAYVHKLDEELLKRMLQEDDSIVQRRAAARRLLEDLKYSIDQVQYLQEKTSVDDDKDKVKVDAMTLALSAFPDLLNADQLKQWSNYISSPFMPELGSISLTEVVAPPKPTAVEAPAAASQAQRGAPSAAPQAVRRAPGPPPAAAAAAAANGPPARRAPPPPPPGK